MRILAIDWGEKRVGLSVSDPLGILVTPLPYIENKGKKQVIEKLKEIIEENDIDTIVMGIPKNIKGEFGERGEVYKKIGEEIEKKTRVKVEFFDERYTSRLAERILREHPKKKIKRKKLRDSLSASIILEGYLASIKK